MHVLTPHVPQLRHECADVLACRVCLLALQVRIENAEIRLRVSACASAPLPPAIVGRKVAINKLLHEMLK